MAKRKAKQPQQPKSPVKKKRNPRASKQIPRSAIEYICSITDPFCPHAQGAKFMDQASVRSLPFTKRERYVVSSDANGNGSLLILPSFIYQSGNSATTITGGGSASFTTVRTSSGNPSAVGQIRLTSAGALIRSIIAPINASGILRIRGFSSSAAAISSAVLIGTYNCDFSSDTPVHSVNEVAVALRRTDDLVKRFTQPLLLDDDTDPSDNNNALISTGPLLISVQGAASTSVVLDVEVVLHWEVTFNDDNSLQAITTAAPPYNGKLDDAASTAMSMSPPYNVKGEKSFSDSMIKIANSAASMAVSEGKELLASFITARLNG